MITAATLPGMLEDIASRRPDATLRFHSARESLTLAELATGARTAAAGFIALGVPAGQPVGLVLPSCRDFLLCFFGALYAAALPSPLALPNAFRSAEVFFERVGHILADAGMHDLVGRASLLAEEPERIPAGLRVLDPAQVMEAGAAAGSATLDALAARAPGPADLALVQYTSGSTSAPKGVALTHQSFLAGMNAIIHGARLTGGDSNGQWLPLYHDMGLIGLLCGIALGMEHDIWSPLTFVKSPSAWLAKFARARATIYAGPNFSYDALLASVDQAALAKLDLSAWRVAFNGAEPIHAGTMERFIAHFANAGFRPATMFPVYGMAELTLAATFPPLGHEPEIAWVDRDALTREHRALPVPRDHARARGVVSVGAPVLGHALRILDPEDGTLVREDGGVGEIALSGPALMRGYYRSPARTAEVLQDGWLRTGDLGFVQDGKLYVTGRSKEMIIVRGTNIYPTDVEVLVRERLGDLRGGCVAFAADGPGSDGGGGAGGDERIVVLVEARPAEQARVAQAAGQVRDALISQLGVDVIDILLVQPRTIERTTSGKQQRLTMRRRFEAGELDDSVVPIDNPIEP